MIFWLSFYKSRELKVARNTAGDGLVCLPRVYREVCSWLSVLVNAFVDKGFQLRWIPSDVSTFLVHNEGRKPKESVSYLLPETQRRQCINHLDLNPMPIQRRYLLEPLWQVVHSPLPIIRIFANTGIAIFALQAPITEDETVSPRTYFLAGKHGSNHFNVYWLHLWAVYCTRL